MKEIIQYLNRDFSPNWCFIDDNNTINFIIDDFKISIKFRHLLEANENNLYEIEEVEELFENISEIEFYTFNISFSEILEERNDESEFYNTLHKKQHKEIISISNFLILLVKEISNIKLDLILNYYTKVLDPYDNGLCGYNPQYIGEIEIDILKLDLKITKDILNILKTIKSPKIEEPYLTYIANNKLVKNKFSAQFLNTNTKVRRLGYLKLFFNFLYEKKQIPENLVNKKFEDFATKYTSQLMNLNNNKGIINNSNGKSAEPYIKLLKEFDLITSVNKVIVPTKWLKTYFAINEIIKEERSDDFLLDEVDSIFFLELILKKDFLYSIVILEFLSLNEICSVKQIVKSFQELLLKRLRLISSQEHITNQSSHSTLREIEKRVSNWKKAEVYLEHLILPRINWLADLNLITLDEENIISVNDNLKRLNSSLYYWKDLTTEYIADSSEFIKLFYPHLFEFAFHGYYRSIEEKEIIDNLIDQYINHSFSIFKTLAPNRVTSSQAITFAKYCIYFKNRFSISETYITQVIETKLSDKYIYKYQISYGDGYIQKINPTKKNHVIR